MLTDTGNVSDSDVLSRRSRNHASSWHLKQTTAAPTEGSRFKNRQGGYVWVCTHTYCSPWHLMFGDCLSDLLMHHSNSLQKQVFLQWHHFYTGREQPVVTWQNVITPLYNQSCVQWKRLLQPANSWWTPSLFFTCCTATRPSEIKMYLKKRQVWIDCCCMHFVC